MTVAAEAPPQTFCTRRFSIAYWTEGPAAVDPAPAIVVPCRRRHDRRREDGSPLVLEPFADPPRVLGPLPDGAAPAYVRRLAFWLERALDVYTAPPFGMPDPTTRGPIPVTVTPGCPVPDPVYGIRIAPRLNDALLAAYAAHETFHLTQFACLRAARPEAPTDGEAPDWFWALFEGGAVFAEDAVTPCLKRYLLEAGPGFAGPGLLAQPNQPLPASGYKASLFWRYLAEQHAREGEPVDWATYRELLERAVPCTTARVAEAVGRLFPRQPLFAFHRVDGAAGGDLVSSETLLGNFILACYLQHEGDAAPDRRFDFRDKRAPIFFVSALTDGQCGAGHLPTLARSGPPTAGAGALAFEHEVWEFGHRVFEVRVGRDAGSLDVRFAADARLREPVFQMVLLDEARRVLDIVRADARTYRRRVITARDGARLARLALVVSAGARGGSFTVSVAPAPASPDVMITRWNCREGTSYEVNPRDTDWTWTSPDLWIARAAKNSRRAEVIAGVDNRLSVRLRNVGNAPAAGIAVALDVQPVARAGGGDGWSPHLSAASWSPIVDARGRSPALRALALPAGATRCWSVAWCPPADAAGTDLCLRATVTVPADPNEDDKQALAIFACRARSRVTRESGSRPGSARRTPRTSTRPRP